LSKDTTTGRPAFLPEEASVPDMSRHPDGQHKDHWVMSAEDRAKGFCRPVRTAYMHQKCGGLTSMPRAIAETYAAKPEFYGRTFCCACRDYFPVGALGEFVWVGTTEKVGT